MRVNIVMPQMGESITEGTLIKWHKRKGESVKKDEIIYEIATDKVDTEIPSPEDGVLADINVFEQETVVVGTVVAVIETNGNGSADTASETKVEEPAAIKTEPASTTQVGGELIDVPMPKMGESVMDGTIIKWHKNVGDKVNRDEIVFEISTDKVDTEVPSPVDGILAEILFKENETVNVGVAVAKIRTTTGLVKEKTALKEDQEHDQDQEKKISKPITNHQSPITKSPTANKFYSPLVLSIARTEGISLNELEMIEGSGIDGRVTKNDILGYLQNKQSGKLFAPVLPTNISEKTEAVKEVKTVSRQQIEFVAMDNTRQRIMQHMVNSRDTSVHVTAVMEVDMSRIHNFVEKNREGFASEGIKLTYLPFISSAVIKALKEFPLMNSSIEGKNILTKKFINLGIAVAVEPNGLIVPNIKNAEEKSIRGLAKAIAGIGLRARTKKLVPEDVVNGTFSITNYGVFGSLFGTPIINQPEVGILGVGAVTKKPVVIDVNGNDAIVIKPMMYLSLSHDHRLIDGMLGGKFLKSIKETLENFDTSNV
ncbi:MAG: 2-oxoglutarate dehydrogenase, E2 component, dihydrolipoamide succinyltransferase [Stygiobacter sp. RIFOXYC12_FULL_38_8]|nr:MAG: 2-oxoglutarate dehydrogenase, E2 component, dihydrolipoamide succinyltransferase [Stygiobacter sp. GWC2_38_9]OGV06314.1 MAG: 2-oxoglutarate dehydrogenase, E2 component, dihydrolipoamide succinyltransferase [Stygiobacter sp. RIFOXYB2_FULL_37_11]OGV11076.1 MAG: 2-oxoglutarate dehydrogenase, E2 component, dihydrolipoamide succinyltransferase [Stygiobacter sp. RIFOXYA2_FULL_38_8]OGV16065.1 MAG: 2-oxoglutarate dehydrogenase, E2 component, dihydrolipoamide succinyltransferase [Stygiobacter sp.